ncbi:MAG TPA: RidA family protein [Burkholderiales bacterium]|nr:RidA family protein [Burkholderiales bacterium]
MGTVESRLAALGLTLPDAPSPAANYLPYTMAKGLIFIAGQAPVIDGKYQSVGRVGAEVTLEAAQAAARLCGLNVLAQVKAAVVGDWSRVRSCVRLCGYVSSAPGFHDQPRVLDGASDLMVQALGDAGKHARSALGVFSLRGNVPVVIDAIFELAD